MIRVGIIGTGRTVSIAQKHFLGLQKDNRATLTAIYNSNIESAKTWVKENNSDAVACKTVDEFFDKVDAVIICSPNSTHLDYAKQANERNKSVLIEKPLSIDYLSAKEFASHCNSTSCLKVGYVYRFNNKIVKLKELIEKKIGRVYFINASMGGRRLADQNIGMEWRMKKDLAGSGALGDFGSHLIDIANFITNDKITSVTGVTKTVIPKRKNADGQLQDVETDDIAVITGQSEKSLFTFTLSRVGITDMRIVVVGCGGTLETVINEMDREITYLEKDISGAYTGKKEIILVDEEKYFDDWFIKQIADFLDAIEGKKSIGTDLTDALYIQDVLQLAKQ